MTEKGSSIGSKLVRLRAGRSQRKVAEALGISISALSMYETDKRVTRDQVKVRLAEFYEVTVQELFF